ncbi:uncharacterized protein LOC106473561 [Limulus polyphemus]|uniref:Uncharacterized protein LOC106473561 n=1 Tax=Limulus polyphemus TaxID=6850 RepID=A0ABM1BVW7_LIMPO|nr:uncharacterized protein LOC106473561 [Limulus polyphemus]
MAFRLDENHSKQVNLKFLDYRNLQIQRKEELNSILWKVPELHLRKERVSESDIIILKYVKVKESFQDKNCYNYLEPIPSSMREVNLHELKQVDIDWRMMTLLRPVNKFEEEIFTRFVQLDRLKMKTMTKDGVDVRKRSTRNDRMMLRPTDNKSKVPLGRYSRRHRSILEDSGDDGKPEEFSYEYFVRQFVSEEPSESTDISRLMALSMNLSDSAKPEKKGNNIGVTTRRSKLGRKREKDKLNSKCGKNMKSSESDCSPPPIVTKPKLKRKKKTSKLLRKTKNKTEVVVPSEGNTKNSSQKCEKDITDNTKAVKHI